MTTGPFPHWSAKAAKALAVFAHHGQVDKGGEPYINHPLWVGDAASSLAVSRGWDWRDAQYAKAVGYLHDVVEDTLVTEEMLDMLGCPKRVREALHRLTHLPNEPRVHYYGRIKDDPIALLVKEVDIEHNTLPERQSYLDEATRERLAAKYTQAREVLGLTQAGRL